MLSSLNLLTLYPYAVCFPAFVAWKCCLYPALLSWFCLCFVQLFLFSDNFITAVTYCTLSCFQILALQRKKRSAFLLFLLYFPLLSFYYWVWVPLNRWPYMLTLFVFMHFLLGGVAYTLHYCHGFVYVLYSSLFSLMLSSFNTTVT